MYVFIHRIYSKALDVAHFYEIKVMTEAIKQDEKSVTEHANVLQTLCKHSRLKCTADVVIQKKFIEIDRAYDFLVGLNNEFDQVRVQIIEKEEMLSLEEIVSLFEQK